MTLREISLTRIVSPVPTSVWRDIYGRSVGALPSQSPDWGAAIVDSGGFTDSSRLYEFSDGTSAVLPLFSRRWPVGRMAPQFSPPSAWGFGGLLHSTELAAGHVRSVLRDVAAMPTAATQIRPNPLQASVWKEGAPEGWLAIPRSAHVLDLEGGYEAVFSRFGTDVRQNIRRAERNGVKVETGNNKELIAAFHGLLRQSFDRWAKVQHEPSFLAQWRGNRRDPIDKFCAMAKALGPHFRLWVARYGGQPAAAILVLLDREAHYTRGAMNKELAAKSNANHLLSARAIEEACAAGCKSYHMGETAPGSSLAMFKSRMGAVAHSYNEYQYERFPVYQASAAVKGVVKRVIGFRDS